MKIHCDYLTPWISGEKVGYFQVGDRVNFGNSNANIVFELFPQTQYQEIIGIGSALTEAAASNFVALSQDQQDKLAQLYFDPNAGIGATMARTHINSADFSISEYIYTTDEDPNLGTYNIDRERKYVLQLVKAALRINPNFKIFSSPWSPPAWMKTNGRVTGGGNLKKEFWDVWAKYMARYVTEFKNEGVNIFMITVQNEPAASQSWESCIYSGEDEGQFTVQSLKPALRAAGHNDVKVFVWDHNRDLMWQRAEASYSQAGAVDEIDGVAMHWYGGDHFDQVDRVHETWPNKMIIASENCAEGANIPWSGWGEADDYMHEIINDFNHWANGYTDWNAFLNTSGGPYHNRGGGVKAPVIVDPAANSFQLQPIYYAIGHFSKFVRPGSHRIRSVLTGSDMMSVAFQNENNGTIVAVLLNRGGDDANTVIRLNGRNAAITVPAHAGLTAVITLE